MACVRGLFPEKEKAPGEARGLVSSALDSVPDQYMSPPGGAEYLECFSSSGISLINPSVVSINPAMLEAFCRAIRTNPPRPKRASLSFAVGPQ